MRVKKVVCEHCQNAVEFKRNKGRWTGRVIGGGVGGVTLGTMGGIVGAGLGVVGAVAGLTVGAAVTIPLALIGGVIGILGGGSIGGAVAKDAERCPICGGSIHL